jgi:hypothetical protein
MRYADITEILKKNGLPTPSKEKITEIAGIEGATLKTNLLGAQGGMPECVEYLGNIIKASAPFCRDTLATIGLKPELTHLIRAAKQEKATLFRAINAVHKQTNNADEARAYLANLFTAQHAEVKQAAAVNDEDPDRLPDFNTFERPAVQQAPAQSAPLRSAPVQSAPQLEARPAQRQPAQPASVAPARTGAQSVQSNAPVAQRQESADRSVANGGHYYNFHVYGQKAALNFSEDELKSSKMKTVRIEGAASLGNGKFGWDKKISFQLTLKELIPVLAVFTGYVQAIELSGHGTTNDKHLAIKRQGQGFFVNVRQRKNAYAVPVPQQDSYLIVQLLRRQIMANPPHSTNEELNELLAQIGRDAQVQMQANQSLNKTMAFA